MALGAKSEGKVPSVLVMAAKLFGQRTFPSSRKGGRGFCWPRTGSREGGIPASPQRATEFASGGSGAPPSSRERGRGREREGACGGGVVQGLGHISGWGDWWVCPCGEARKGDLDGWRRSKGIQVTPPQWQLPVLPFEPPLPHRGREGAHWPPACPSLLASDCLQLSDGERKPKMPIQGKGSQENSSPLGCWKPPPQKNLGQLCQETRPRTAELLRL